MIYRENTRPVSVGGLQLGGGAPVTVQSMCNTKTWDVEKTVQQIKDLRAAGCEIVRLAEEGKTDPAARRGINDQAARRRTASLSADH